MTDASHEKDVVFLVSDDQMKFAVEGLLSRGLALGFQNISFDIYVHPNKDPGCLLRAHDFLRAFHRQYRCALVMFDREGCGREGAAEDLEREVEQRLSAAGWGDRAAVVVIDPELEIWVWSDSQQVDDALGWTGHKPPLKQWLRDESHIIGNAMKPHRPKEALEKALRLARKARSSAIFLELAKHVSVRRCQDRAFLKFKGILQRWFCDPPKLEGGML
jgi:hypothetical protein